MSNRDLDRVEISRLSMLNARTLCITFPYLKSRDTLPSYTSMLSMSTSIQSLVYSKAHNPWLFLIFPSKELKMDAEMDLNNKMCGNDLMMVENSKTLVPVQDDDLVHTREVDCLAIHGLLYRTSEEDLKTVFPRANHIIVAKRGGSAFLKYYRNEECIEDFLNSEHTEVNGVSVVVMFGHKIPQHSLTKDGREDLRDRLNICRTRELWEPFLQFYKKKGRNEDVSNGKNDENEGKNDDNERKNDDNEELLDVLLSCSLELERMKRQFIRVQGKEEEREVKTKWLDILVGRAIEKYSVPEYDAKVYNRGGFREIVEDIWTYFEENEGNRTKDNFRYNTRRDRSRSSSGGRRRASVDVRKKSRIHYVRNATILRQTSSSSKETSRSSRSRSRSRLSVTVNSHDIIDDGKDRWEINCAAEIEINNNKEGLGSMTPKLIERESPSVLSMPVTETTNTLGPYVEKKLLALGLKESVAALESSKIVAVAKHVMQDVGNAALTQDQALQLLGKFGYESGHVSDRLVADLLVDWAARAHGEATKRKENIVQKMLNDGYDEDSEHGIPPEIMGVEEGYPRMALVMAFVLHTEKGLDEQISKDLARAMVGVWITYGFTYKQMCEICLGRGQKQAKVEMLRRMLTSKLTEGFVKPMSFGFSKLIKLTLFYFAHAV